MHHFADRVRPPSPRKSAPAPAPVRPQPARPRPVQQAALGQVLQRYASAAARPVPAPTPRTDSRGGLPERLRAGVERLSGFFMGDVRVHRNSAEPAKLGALAYAKGGDIHLGPGQEQHLPHEAWHVVQQKEGRVAATAQMKGWAVNEDPALEAEADRMGSRVEFGSSARERPDPFPAKFRRRLVTCDNRRRGAVAPDAGRGRPGQ